MSCGRPNPCRHYASIYTIINFTRYSATEVGALSVAGWACVFCAWLTHATVGSGCGWLGVVCAWSTHAMVGSGCGRPGVVCARSTHATVGSGCGWLGVVCAWSTHATVGSGRGWLGVVAARRPELSGWLGVTGRCASTGGVLVTIRKSDKMDLQDEKTTGQSNLRNRPHHHHTWTVQLYSPGGANMHRI